MELTVVVLADTQTHGDLGRLANALETASDALQSEGKVELLLDGAGTRWIEQLEDPEHKYHRLWLELKPHTGVCSYCARAFGVFGVAKSAGVALLDERRGHPRLFDRLERGAAVLTF